jgi:hypothetical protein
VDADPAGLAIAAQLPNLVGLVLQPLDVLKAQLSDPRTRRQDLYYAQYPGYGGMLDGIDENHVCRPAWNLISQFKAGVVQDRWMDGLRSPVTIERHAGAL